GLVKTVFVVEPDGEGQFRLTRLNAGAHQFEPCDWPQEMTGLRQQLEEFASHGRPRAGSPDGPEPPRPLPVFDEDLPALILPLIKPMRPMRPEGHGAMLFPGPQHFPAGAGVTALGKERGAMPFLGPQGFTIITLDMRYIQQEVLPALAKRH